jgi:AraC-like DNA-binding protein
MEEIMNQEQALSSHNGLDVDGFRSKFNSIICSLDCSVSDKSDSFSTSLVSVRLGVLDLLRYDGYGLSGGRRGFRHIREDLSDDFILALPLTVPVVISQSRRSTTVEPGSCVLLATARPFVGKCGIPPSYIYSEFVLRIPGPLLRQHVPYIDDCCARSINVNYGAGKVLLSLVESLIEERADYSELQAKLFGKIVLNAVANVARGAPELADFQSRQSRSAHSRIFECARDFIESNLSNSSLDPSRIATHCNISVSYLHAAFAATSWTVGGFTKEIRLQRCRAALQNPLMRHHSIIETAMQWGFNSSSSFNHAYRARFGKSPSEERLMSLTTPVLGESLTS